MKNLYLFIGLLLFATSAFAQPLNLHGTVVNNKGVALSGVKVTVKETSATTQTDSAGAYSFAVDSGTYNLEFSLTGYTISTKAILAANPAGEVADVTLIAEEPAPAAIAEPNVIKPAEPVTTPLKQATEGNKIYGTITDEKDGSPMMGVVLKVKGGANGAQTDVDGKYALYVAPGTYTLEVSYLGYAKRSLTVSILLEKEKKLDVRMTEEVREMDIVVVTGSKYEKKLSEEVVSMEVLKSSVINQNSARMDEAMNKVPGVNMLGKTISIRGGSGFSDATGNRVLALLDEMPIISPENGSIRWETVPIEMLEQVEVIKGTASAVYGSSALSGVLNMRTVQPKAEMVNKILINYGFYDQPYQHSWSSWWNRKVVKRNGDTINRVQHRMFGGGQFMHAKQYGDFGVVVGGSYNQDQGFRQSNDYKRVRGSAKLRYTPHKMNNLTIGLNMNFFHETLKDFFTGKGTGKFMYVPNEVVETRARTFNIDPYLNYYDKQENRHSLKFRIFNTMSNSNAGVGNGGTGDSTTCTQYYFDYSFLRKFKKINMVVTTGLNGFYSLIRGKTFGKVDSAIINPAGIPYNSRYLANVAAYVQLEKKFFNKLTLTGGIRLEFAMLDTSIVQYPFHNLKKNGKTPTSPVAPLFRFGLNYQATEGTFIRASIGQGFRYPSMSEKYIHTIRSGVEVFPNDTLRPEKAWSAEIGIKQGVKISKWMAYFDVAGYYTQYRDMIEFATYNPPPGIVPAGIPFQAVNIGHARVAGCELSAVANGKIFGVPLNFLIGYSYLYPENLDYNPADPKSVKILKYRMQHSAKADIQTNYKGVTLGISGFYNSFMKNIDEGQLGTLKSVQEFRASHNKGDFVMDVRAGYSYKAKATFMFICKNVLNREYMLRPALIEAPRNFTFQVGYNF